MTDNTNTIDGRLTNLIEAKIRQLHETRRRCKRLVADVLEICPEGTNTNRLGEAKRNALKAVVQEARQGCDEQGPSYAATHTTPRLPVGKPASIICLDGLREQIEILSKDIESLSEASGYDLQAVKDAHSEYKRLATAIPDTVRQAVRNLTLCNDEYKSEEVRDLVYIF